MARYHINPRTGRTSACGATKSCPFGDMETGHYPTREAAQEAYEKRMSEEKLPPAARRVPEAPPAGPREAQPLVSDGKRQRALRNLVEKPADDDTLSIAAAHGDEAVLRAVAVHPTAKAEHLQAALERAQNGKTRKLLEERLAASEPPAPPAPPAAKPSAAPRGRRQDTRKKAAEAPALPSELTPETYNSFLKTPEGVARIREELSTGSDSFARHVVEHTYAQSPLHDAVVTSENLAVSAATRLAAFQKAHPMVLNRSLAEQDSFPTRELLPHMNYLQKEALAKHNGNPATLELLAEDSARLAAEGTVSESIHAEEAALALLKNPALPEASRAVLEGSGNRRLRAVGEVRRRAEADPQGFQKLIVGSERGVAGEAHIRVDREQVEALGLDAAAVGVYIRDVAGLAVGPGARGYNPATGLYSYYTS